MFKPLAYTVVLAMVASLMYSLFLAPVVSSFVMKYRDDTNQDSHEENLWIHRLIAMYQSALQSLMEQKNKAFVIAVGIFSIGLLTFPFVGSEFIPALDEGDLLVRLTMAPSISLEEAKKTVLIFEKRLLENFPEVDRVSTRVGRGEVGAHADPVNSGEAFIAFKPVREWRRTTNPRKLYAMMSKYFESFPSVKFNFTQPIAASVDELLTGTKAELAIKIFGHDMEILQEKAVEIEAVIRNIEGAYDVQKEQVTGTPQLRLVIDREALARYGVNVSDVQNLLKIAVGGERAGQIFEGIRRFDIVVRYEENKRNAAKAISQILVDTPSGLKVPLQDLVMMEEVIGPRQITRENNQRFITVQCNVRGRDIGSFVAESQKVMKNMVKMPAGYSVDWGGQFELQQEANRRLRLVVPFTLLIVCLLLFLHFSSLMNVALILLVLPLAMVGGIVALKITGQNLSVPASVGFIALFGIALQDAMVLLTTMNGLQVKGVSIVESAVKGACIVFRPVMMTTLTTMLGLFPLLFSLSTGSEVQRPLATVVVGGLLTSTCVTLFLLPVFYRFLMKRDD
jgi:cobalt-zinc-cadmium resistance protein CzcA